MEKKRNSQTIIIAVLAVAVLFMSIGFAAFSQTLNIQSSVDVSEAKWDIHWDTSSYAKSAGSVDILNPSKTANSSPTLTNTDISFGAKLEKPGDYAEFTVNAVNAGTFDAKLTAITISPELTAAQQKYLSYTVTYAGTEYHTSTSGLNVSLPAKSSNTVTVKVRVDYNQPTNAADLPSADTTIAATISFDYEQATN